MSIPRDPSTFSGTVIGDLETVYVGLEGRVVPNLRVGTAGSGISLEAYLAVGLAVVTGRWSTPLTTGTTAP